MKPSTRPDVVLLDLDGVVWLAGQPIPGSVEAIVALQAAGVQVGFVTNSSAPRVAGHEAALAAIGVDATGAVVSSAVAAASLVGPGEVALVCGGEGLVEAVALAGAETIVAGSGDGVRDDVGAVSTVVVGLDREFTYAKLAELSAAIRGGARFIATNRDHRFPTPSGPLPGAGTVVAAVAVASDVEPIVAGKPCAPMVAVARERFGLDGRRVVMVGDQHSTDGLFATALGAEFALVRTGNTAPGTPLDAGEVVAYDAADLGTLAAALLAG